MFQSPSLRGSGRFKEDGCRRGTRTPVSIPFIAGQWSLPAANWGGGPKGLSFQSPSLRGSGRFGRGGAVEAPSQRVSIPFIAGQWSLRAPPLRRRRGRKRVSIPFIAGQWSLESPAAPAVTAAAPRFQSPSLRGSGRFPSPHGGWAREEKVSIPFIAGQWSLKLAAGWDGSPFE